MINQESLDKVVFDFAYSYLLSFKGITKELLEHSLTTSDENRPDSIERIYLRLITSAQNAEMMPKVIGGSIGGINKLKDITFQFNPKQVVSHYNNDFEQLLESIKSELKPKGKIRLAARSKWPRFCKAVLSGARFLSQFDSPSEFYQWCDFFDHDDRARLALPLLICDEIDGFGFALACDFLKELGYRNFGKPDVHIITIFTELGLSDSKRQTRVYKAIQRIAKSVGRDSFAVDKLFWIIGSGYLHEITIKTDRDDFIQQAKEHIGIANANK